jgi:hypothetical protein
MEMPESAHQRIPGLLLTMADVRKLPRIEMVTEFKCIEGWSEIVCWGGVRLRDFLEAFPPQIEEASQLHPSAFEQPSEYTPGDAGWSVLRRYRAPGGCIRRHCLPQMNRQVLTLDRSAARPVTCLKWHG